LPAHPRESALPRCQYTLASAWTTFNGHVYTSFCLHLLKSTALLDSKGDTHHKTHLNATTVVLPWIAAASSLMEILRRSSSCPERLFFSASLAKSPDTVRAGMGENTCTRTCASRPRSHTSAARLLHNETMSQVFIYGYTSASVRPSLDIGEGRVVLAQSAGQHFEIRVVHPRILGKCGPVEARGVSCGRQGEEIL
jgi:hypothetical protein